MKKIRYRIRVLQKLSLFAQGVRKLFVIDCAAAVAALFLSLAQPQLYRIFMEEVILKGRLRPFAVVAAGYIIVQLLGTGLAFLRNFCRYRLNNQVTLRMKEKILQKILARDIRSYLRVDPGKEKAVMDDAVVKMCDFCQKQSGDYLVNLGKAFVLLILLFWMDWRLALILVAALPVTFFLNHRNGVRSRKNNDEIWQNDRKWNEWNYDSATAWREIRAMNMERFCEEKFAGYAREYRRLRAPFIRHWVTRVFVIPAIKDEFILQFLLYFLGGLLVFSGRLSIGSLLVFAQYYAMLTDAVQAVVGADTSLEVNRTYYDRALEALEEENVSAEEKTKEPSDMDIEFRNVTFRYEDGEREILSGFSERIRTGERVGVVGESGIGKTTLLHLLVGILTPTKGVVTVGGIPVERIRESFLFDRVGFVLQENVLFNDTIRENLLYGRETATEDDMRKACQKAHIWEFIEGLSEGLDTVIGEKGIRLSGGQRQRLVLARLFLRDAEVFVFDEATSALDQHNEGLIQQALREIGRDKTILVAAHRKSSLAICERQICL